MYNNDPKYMNPQQGLASLVNSPYGDSDVMQVKMTPREVAGLQQLALNYGASEQDLYDPITGQPKFSFLKKILPMIAGAVLPGIPGVGKFAETIGFGSQALGTALIVGGATGLIEGDLKKGLMAGLGAYSGAKIGEGLTASASKVGGAAPAPATESTVQTAPAQRFTQDFGVGEDIAALTTPPPAPVSAPITPITTTTPPPSTGFFGTMGRGIAGLMKPEGRTAFMDAMGGPISKSAVFMGVADALTPTPKPFPMGGAAGEDIVYIPGGFNPQYGTGRGQPYQLPGRYYKRTPQGLMPYNPFQITPGVRGFAEGGMVPGGPETLTPINISPYAAPTTDPNVLATRAYIEELNRRARTPYTGTYPGTAGSGLGGFGTPGTYQPSTGGVVGGGDAGVGGGLGAIAGSIATNYLINKGVGAGVDYLKDKLFPDKTEEQQPTPEQQRALADQKFAQDFALDPTIAALTLPTFAQPQTSLPPTRTTVEPLSYEGEEMVVREDPTVTQQVQQPAAPTSPITIANAALAATSPFAAPPEFAGTPGYEITPLEDPNFPGQSTGETQVSGQAQPAAPTSPVTYTSAALNALNPFVAPTTTALPYIGEPVYNAAGELSGFKYPDGTIESVEPTTKEPGQLDADLQAKTQVPDTSAPLSSYLSAGSSGLAGLAGLGSAARTGLTSIIPLDPATGAVQTFLSPGSSAAANAAAVEGAKAAGAEIAGAEAAKTGLGKSAILPGLQTALGAYETYEGIRKGEESRAALGGFGLGAGLAGLGSAGVSSLSGLAALGATPVGLAIAAIAAIGASMVNTKEFGDVALRNYWNAVDQGRGIGETDPTELAQGFINFYRTNKNEFPGQAKYGRTGNEDFVYDMTQVINDAVKSGKVAKDVDPGTMYKEVVQPWLNTMGEGPQNEDAKRIQDFMMTDLINSFMQGKPISNAQVKGDSKYKIVSEKPVYAGAVPPTLPTAIPRTEPINEFVREAGLFASQSPFAAPEERVMPRREMERELERESIMPPPDFSGIDAGLIPEAPPFDPMRGVSFGDDREGIMPTNESEALYEPLNPYGYVPERFMFAGGGAIGDDYNFGFKRGGMPEYLAGGKLLKGPGDGMSDSIPAVIRGKGVQRAALADGEFVIPADVVSHLGNGSTNAGAKKLYAMMNKIRQARTGKTRQAPAVKADRYLPA